MEDHNQLPVLAGGHLDGDFAQVLGVQLELHTGLSGGQGLVHLGGDLLFRDLVGLRGPVGLAHLHGNGLHVLEHGGLHLRALGRQPVLGAGRAVLRRAGLHLDLHGPALGVPGGLRGLNGLGQLLRQGLVHGLVFVPLHGGLQGLGLRLRGQVPGLRRQDGLRHQGDDLIRRGLRLNLRRHDLLHRHHRGLQHGHGRQGHLGLQLLLVLWAGHGLPGLAALLGLLGVLGILGLIRGLRLLRLGGLRGVAALLLLQQLLEAVLLRGGLALLHRRGDLGNLRVCQHVVDQLFHTLFSPPCHNQDIYFQTAFPPLRTKWATKPRGPGWS